MSYGVEALKETRGDGLSGFSSRSEQARARELKKYNLTMQWYDDRVHEQQNLCADCGKQEKRLGNGTNKKRPLGLGFDENGRPSRLICQLCASKQRKARMEEKNAPKDFDSLEAFWQANRGTLQKENPAELVRLQERDAEIREIYSIICIYLRDHDGQPCYQLTDTLDEIEAELVNQGTTDLDQLSAPFYRVEHRQLYEEIQNAASAPDAPKHARNAAVFAKYGLLIALPVSTGDHIVREFLRRYGRWPYPDWSKPPNPIKSVKCSTYGCHNEFTYDINAELPPAQWYCPECRAVQEERKPSGRTLAEVAPDRLYLVNGKLTTPDTTTPAWFANLAKLPGGI